MSIKPVKDWKELENSLNSLINENDRDSSGRSISDLREAYMLQIIYFAITKPISKYYRGYFEKVPFSPITNDLIQKARLFQSPIKIFFNKYDPEYLPIPSGDTFAIQRKGNPGHDMLICGVASCLKGRSMKISNGSASELAFEAVQHYEKIPIVNFFSSLPYLFDYLEEKGKNSSFEELSLEELFCSQMRCIDGLLFHIYDELNEGEVITDESITAKVMTFFSGSSELAMHKHNEGFLAKVRRWLTGAGKLKGR